MITLIAALTVLGMTPSAFAGFVVKTLLALCGTYAVPWLLPKVPDLTKKLFEWITHSAAAVHNQYVAGVLSRLSTLVGEKVLAYENTQVEYLKDQAAAGKITYEELPRLLAEMKAKLLAEVKQDATAQALWADALKVFAGDAGSLGSWLAGLVETHVATLPPSGLQSAKTNGTPAALAKAVNNTAKASDAPASVTPPANPQ